MNTQPSPRTGLTPPAQFEQEQPSALAPGTRVKLPRSKRSGVVLVPAWLMPHHTLVQLDDGDRQWFLTSILEVVPKRDKKTRKQK